MAHGIPRAVAAALIGWAAVGPALAADDWTAKIDSRLNAAGQSTEPIEFLAMLGEQADLTDIPGHLSKTEKGRRVFRQLRATAARTQSALLDELRARGAAYRPFWIVNLVWVRGGSDLLRTVAARPEVARLCANPAIRAPRPEPDRAVAPRAPAGVEWGLAKVQAPGVWALGFTGQTVVVGGIDTGYQWDHPALKRQYRGFDGAATNHDFNWHDAVHQPGSSCGANSPFPCDDHGHGTHTMGTMVGDDGAGNQIGMAPGARWIGCRCMNAGDGTPAMYLECLEWMLAPTDRYNHNPDPDLAPHVINNSWGCPADTEGCIDPDVLLPAVRALRAAGIVVVASAGNEGPGCGTIRDPISFHDDSFTIGATDSSDGIVAFSSRGPVTADGSGRLKPDVVAPGLGIRSSLPGGAYGSMSGTSMAGPHVAGLVALMISANTNLAGDVAALEQLIRQTAVPRTTTQSCGDIPGSQVPNNTFGYGRIDALAAVTAALGFACGPANVQLQPAAQPLGPGQVIQFTAAAQGVAPLDWQWFAGPAGATNRPIGSNSPILTLVGPVSFTACWARAVNRCGFADSGPVFIDARPAVTVVVYVALGGAHAAPYTNWVMAATNIQAAIEVCPPGGTVLVSNGLYQTGGAVVHSGLLSRVAVTSAITVRGVNGPAATVIRGAGPIGAAAVRCAYVGAGAVLAGFTLTNGATRGAGAFVEDQRGGGAWCAPGGIITNCRVVNNAAFSSGGGVYDGVSLGCELAGNTAAFGAGAGQAVLRRCVLRANDAAAVDGLGGGAFAGELENCLIFSNSAQLGGGACESRMRHCTVVDNAALAGGAGGGIFYGSLVNCLVYFNTITGSPNNVAGGQLAYTCTWPDPGGAGNLTNPPVFMDRPAGDYRLQAGSPGIDAGTDSLAVALDYAGVDRPLDGDLDGQAAYDLGAFEFVHPLADSDADGLRDTNELARGTNPARADTDGDRMGDGHEVFAGTDPLRADSYLGLLTPGRGGFPPEGGWVVQWLSVSGRLYTLSRATNLVEALFSTVASDIPGQSQLTTHTDATAVGFGPCLYRIGVQPQD